MDYISRPKYTERIKAFVDTPVIKVLSGMRRVGKSTLLQMIKDELLKHVPEKNKIYINFESADFIRIHNSLDVIDYLAPLINRAKGKIYFFFDEVQLVSEWEKVVNGLRVDQDCDIYLTGSNSTLISGDLATLLAGRYIEFQIQPFGFSEFIRAFAHTKLGRQDLFNKYIRLGGMPFLKYFDLEESPSLTYLRDVYNTVLVKDVLEYNQIRDVDIFHRILTYLLENIGHTFSANSIKKYFKSENRKVSVDTILNYLEYCRNAFLIKRVRRYDSLGKKILKADEKYYVTDHGFRGARGFSNTKDIERVLENMVCIELISRGYEVKTGKIHDKEIDFIAEKSGEISYYQVSYLMESEKTRQREFGGYKRIKDNYSKYVLSMDQMDFSQDGIIHKNMIDFLLEE